MLEIGFKRTVLRKTVTEDTREYTYKNTNIFSRRNSSKIGRKISHNGCATKSLITMCKLSKKVDTLLAAIVSGADYRSKKKKEKKKHGKAR